MSTTEEPVPESTLNNLVGAAGEGADIVGVSMEDESSKILEAVNRYIAGFNQGDFSAGENDDPEMDNWDRSLPIGCLWGQTMVRHFGWHWASLTQHDHDDVKVIAVVNQDRSLAIFPFHYCYGCLENDIYPTILLAFNMLESGFVPPVAPNGFFNMMDGVQHILPPG